jgi:hypothetical protein
MFSASSRILEPDALHWLDERASDAEVRACEEILASGPKACPEGRMRRTERSDETYRYDWRGASAAQRSYRDAEQIYSQALRVARGISHGPPGRRKKARHQGGLNDC